MSLLRKYVVDVILSCMDVIRWRRSWVSEIVVRAVVAAVWLLLIVEVAVEVLVEMDGVFVTSSS